MTPTESPEERREREALRRRAALWLPSLPTELVDEIVASAWLTQLEAGADAVVETRRLGVQALAGDTVRLQPGARRRVAAIALHVPPRPEAAPRRARRRLPLRGRRALHRRPRRLGRRARLLVVGAPALSVLALAAIVLANGGGAGNSGALRGGAGVDAAHNRAARSVDGRAAADATPTRDAATRVGAVRTPAPAAQERAGNRKRSQASRRRSRGRSGKPPRSVRPPQRQRPAPVPTPVAPAPMVTPSPPRIAPSASPPRITTDHWTGEFRP